MSFTKRNPSFKKNQGTTFTSGDTAGLTMWAKQRNQEIPEQKRVWGRIQDTGVNYVVEGYQGETGLVWVRIPCRRLLDAQTLLSSVMPKEFFHYAKDMEEYLRSLD